MINLQNPSAPAEGGGGGAWEVLAESSIDADGSETTLATGSFEARKFLKLLISFNCTGSTVPTLQFNGDTGPNYGYDINKQDTFRTVGTSQTVTRLATQSATKIVSEVLINNTSGIPKAGSLSTSGVAVSVQGSHFGGISWNNNAQITSILMGRFSGTFKAGTKITVLGRD